MPLDSSPLLRGGLKWYRKHINSQTTHSADGIPESTVKEDEQDANHEFQTVENGTDGEAKLAPETEEEAARGKICILSVDGGGMRGVIPSRILTHLERKLQKRSGDPGARVADYFDLAAGTSVGALLIIMLFTGDQSGRPIFSAEETWKFMKDNSIHIFHSPWWTKTYSCIRGIFSPKFSVKSLERVLQGYLSRDGRPLTLRDTMRPVLVPCFDITRSAVFLFSRLAALEHEQWNFNLWEVLRATSAAPGLFRPHFLKSVDGSTEVTAIDGALVMNNPTSAAIAHVMNNKEEFPHCTGARDMLILSIGTGQFGVVHPFAKVRKWGAVQWTKPVLKIITDGISGIVDQTVSLAFPKDVKNQYLRLQVSDLPKSAFDQSSDPSLENIMTLTALADRLLKQKGLYFEAFGPPVELEQTNEERLDLFVDALIREHESRKGRLEQTVSIRRTDSFNPAT